MKVLGLKFGVNGLDYAVLGGSKTSPFLICAKSLKVPSRDTWHWAELLHWFGKTFADIINEYQPDYIAYKDLEWTRHRKKKTDFQRCEIAGVLMCVAVQISRSKYCRTCGHNKANIKKSLGRGFEDDNWEALFDETVLKETLPKNKDQQQAIAVAWSVL